MSNFIDLTTKIDSDDVACCPFCDNPILELEGAALFFAHGCKMLGHSGCIEANLKEMESNKETKHE